MPQTLDYSSTPPPRQRVPWLVLVGVAAVIAVAHWRVTDWGMYLEDYYGPGQDWRKGDWPVGWQVLESAFVGVIATAVLYALFRLARWWLR